jgi:hypothetical protein
VEEMMDTRLLLGALAAGGGVAMLAWMVGIALNLIGLIAAPDLQVGRGGVMWWVGYARSVLLRVVGLALTGSTAVLCVATSEMFLWR